MAEGEFEGGVEGVGEGGGGQDTHRMLAVQTDRAPYSQLWQGGEEGEEEEGEEEEPALLEPGQHPGCSLHQQQADQADDHVVGQSLPVSRDSQTVVVF